MFPYKWLNLRCSKLKHTELLIGNLGSEQLHISTSLVAKHDILQAYGKKVRVKQRIVIRRGINQYRFRRKVTFRITQRFLMNVEYR